MNRNSASPRLIATISEQHKHLGLPRPQHPLVSVFRFEEMILVDDEAFKNFTLDFYCIAIKKNFTGKLKYGQRYYDFDEGMMSFISPRQVLSLEEGEMATEGYNLSFHADFIAAYPLVRKLKQYGFFSYALNEALHLSEVEEKMIEGIMKSIALELQTNIDHFSQDIIVSQLELLLNYSNRFYKRQFLTRNAASYGLLAELEEVLSKLLSDEVLSEKGLPTVHSVAAELHVSASYLSDMLRTLTGQNTQQQIHARLIERAKEMLSATSMSVSEIAFQLGFEHPQSFNKLFKNKMHLSPLEFREKFN